MKELEAKNKELTLLDQISKEDVTSLKLELASAERMNRSMQKVCAHMARVATDGTKKRGKGLTGVMELAEKSMRPCLQEHANFVTEKVWPTVKRMPDN